MVVFGKPIYEQWFASCSTWVGHEPSSRPCWTVGLVFASKHTWWKGWVNRALRNFPNTGFCEVSEAVWPGSEESVIEIIATFQTSGKKTTFDGLPWCHWLSRAGQAGRLAGLFPRAGSHHRSRSLLVWLNQAPRDRNSSSSGALLGTKPRLNKPARAVCSCAPAERGPGPYTEPHWSIRMPHVSVTQSIWAKSAPVAPKHHLPSPYQHGLFHPMQTQWLIN